MDKHRGQCEPFKMSHLKLSCLGSPEIYHNNQPLTFRTRKTLALLIYLAVEGGQQSREKLTALFWPESDSSRGRGMLRTTLRHLRKVMDPLDERYLIIDNQTLGFNTTLNVDFDLQLVETTINKLEQGQPQSNDDQFIAKLQMAVDCYRGSFLEGFTLGDTPDFDDWITLQREMWQERANRLFETLTQRYFERGDLGRGIETATRWQAHDPFNEAAALQLIQLHFANHNRTAALQTYEAYQTVVEAEFGVVPSARMEALTKRIRASTIIPMPSPTIEKQAPNDLTFVGRSDEFARLKAIFEQTRQGQTQVAILTGEAGIGKTRLATQFLTWATANGADILTGRAFEAGGRLPYQPLVQCFRSRIAQENAPDDLLPDIWLAELSRLLPDLRDRYPDLSEPQADESTAQTRLFEAMARLGQALAERGPLLIFLDDAQWADLASLDALQFVLAHWNETEAPILLLLSARSEAFATNAESKSGLMRLTSEVSSTRFDLDNLSQEEILGLVTTLQPNQAKTMDASATSEETKATTIKLDVFAEALHTETAGHPFFVTETIKALLEQRILVPAQTSQGGAQLMWRTLTGDTKGRLPFLRVIPMSVRQAILDRLARLTPTAKTLLTSAAVLGQETTFEQLCQVSALEEMAGLDALEALVERRLLLERPEMTPTYLVAHDLMRDVLYEEVGTARKRILHRRAMTVLPEAEPARLAYHALAAGAIDAAFDYSIAAGDAAFALSAADEAVSHYETAHQLLSDTSLSTPEMSVYQHLYTRLGRALELKSTFEAALAIYEELEQVAKQHNDPTVEMAAVMGQITICALGGSPLFDPERAAALLTHASDRAKVLNDQAIEVEILWRMMQLYIFGTGQLQDAIEIGERALALARELDLPEQIGYVLGDLSIAANFAHIQPYSYSLELMTEAGQIWQALGNRSMETNALSICASIYSYMGRYDEAFALSAKSHKMCLETDNLWGLWASRSFIGYSYLERGQVDQALEVLEYLVGLGEEHGFPYPLTYCRANLALVYGAIGLLDKGLETAYLALEADVATRQVVIHISAILAQLYLKQGQPEKAQSLVDQALTDPQRQKQPKWAVYLPVVQAELALHHQNYEQVLEITAAYIADLHHLGIRKYLLPPLFFRGQALLGQNQPDAARACWLEALAAAEEMKAHRWQWQILFALSQLESDPAEAERHHQQARDIIATIVEGTPLNLRDSFLTLPEVQAVVA